MYMYISSKKNLWKKPSFPQMTIWFKQIRGQCLWGTAQWCGHGPQAKSLGRSDEDKWSEFKKRIFFYTGLRKDPKTMDPYIAANQGMKPYCRLNLYGCRPRIEARKSGHKNRGWTPQLVGWHCVGCLVRYRCDETSMEGFTYVYEMLQGRSG